MVRIRGKEDCTAAPHGQRCAVLLCMLLCAFMDCGAAMTIIVPLVAPIIISYGMDPNQHCGHYHLPGSRPVPVCDGSHCRNHHWRAGQACDQAQRTAGAGGLAGGVVPGGICLGNSRRTHSGGVTEKRANKIICLRALCGACGLFCVRQPGFAIRRQIEYNIL